MPTRKFRELLKGMPAERQAKINARVKATIATMHLDELRQAREMTQIAVAAALGVNQSEISKSSGYTEMLTRRHPRSTDTQTRIMDRYSYAFLVWGSSLCLPLAKAA